MYFEILRQMKKQLGQLDACLAAAATHAASRSFDPSLLLASRLAPDQFPLVRQVQIACDTAKLAAARLAGREAPKHEDNEATIEQLQNRIREVIAYLEDFKPAELEAAATRVITQPRWNGKWMTGADYFLEHALPNFYFHVSHAYALLRHTGVPLGKRDYLGPLTQREP